MKIALIAPFEESVPPQKYGGTELIVYNLVTEFVKMGHDVTVFGTGGTDLPCKVVAIYPNALRSYEPFNLSTSNRDAAKIVGIGKILELLQNETFDIIHNHQAWQILAFNKFIKTPVVTTLHEQLYPWDARIGYESSPILKYISISKNQQLGDPKLNYIDIVYNGINTDLYSFNDKPIAEKYLIFLGRMSTKKGVKEAIEIAKKTNMKLYLLHKISQVEMEYWRDVEKLIDGNQIVGIGEVNLETKIKYLQNAYAMISPIQWEEPFGLNVVESMSCGTPVLGTTRGSYPELITNGKDGFITDNAMDLANYVEKIQTLDRSNVRSTVLNKFTKKIMAENYIKVYEKIIKS